jgi:regulator of protease activity HflC (stomatin/prohibitin superfamily)
MSSKTAPEGGLARSAGRLPLWLKGLFIGFGVLVLAFLVIPFYVIVPAGHRAVVFSLSGGVQQMQHGEGFHLIKPFVERAELFDVRQQTYSMSRTDWEGPVHGDDTMATLTADGQKVQVELSVRYHLDPNSVWRLYQKIGRNYERDIIRPELRSHTRIAIAEFPASRVFSTERRTIERNIAQRLTPKLEQNYILVDEVLLRDVRFSPEFQKAIIDKQIAQQNAQRMKYVLDRERLERQRKVILAEGEALAIRLKGQAVDANAKVTGYEYARKIAPNIRTIITDGRTVPMPATR